jgi:hypothetical protein
MRQTWEEIGLDLAERDYTCIGQLDDREITTSLGKRLLMILSPFVFLQLTPSDTPTDPAPSTTLHWTSLASLAAPHSWSTVTVDAASRLAPKHSVALRILVRALVGSMQFPAIVLEPFSSSKSDEKSHSANHLDAPSQKLKLWGLSLGMTMDLLSYMNPAPSSPSSRTPGSGSPPLQLPFQSSDNLGLDVVSPSLASVFPRFSYPDVNFWIWCALIFCTCNPSLTKCRVFGKRYREVVRGWEASVRSGGTNDRRCVLPILLLHTIQLGSTE